MRYVQQSPYGGAVPYRESPYTVPRNPVSHMANCLAAQLCAVMYHHCAEIRVSSFICIMIS
jgi:hypothetical protein